MKTRIISMTLASAVALLIATVTIVASDNHAGTTESSTSTTTAPSTTVPGCVPSANPTIARVAQEFEFLLKWPTPPAGCSLTQFSLELTQHDLTAWTADSVSHKTEMLGNGDIVLPTNPTTDVGLPRVGVLNLTVSMTSRASYVAEIRVEEGGHSQPMAIQAQVKLGGHHYGSAVSTALICHNNHGYASNLTIDVLTGASANTPATSNLRADYERGCGVPPPPPPVPTTTTTTTPATTTSSSSTTTTSEPPATTTTLSTTTTTTVPVAASTFTPQVAIGVRESSNHVGKQFTVSFSPTSDSPDGCTDDAEDATYAVNSNGVVEPSDVAAVVAGPNLIDRPIGQTRSCMYNVRFPVHEDDGSSLVSHDLDTIASATDRNASATYTPSTAQARFCDPTPVRSLRDDGSSGESLNRRYRWNTPARWSSRCRGYKGYHVQFNEYRSRGLADALTRTSVTTWTGDVVRVRNEPHGFQMRFHHETLPIGIDRTITNWIGRHATDITWHTIEVDAYTNASIIGSHPLFGGGVFASSKIVCPRGEGDRNGIRLTNIDAPVHGVTYDEEWLNALRLACGFATSGTSS